jgi:HSP20 family protein
MNLDRLKEWMELARKFGDGDLWDLPFPPGGGFPGKTFYPAADIVQTAEETIVTIELPGLRKEDFHLAVSGHILRLTGKTGESAGREVKSILSERFHGSFDREIRLPHLVDGSRAAARLADGLLTVRFPRGDRTEEEIRVE